MGRGMRMQVGRGDSCSDGGYTNSLAGTEASL